MLPFHQTINAFERQISQDEALYFIVVMLASPAFAPVKASCPPLPSEFEAMTSGAERSRPLKSVGKRNKKRRDEAQRELQSKRARRDSSSSSSEGELFKDL